MKSGTRLTVAVLIAMFVGGAAVGIAANRKNSADPTDRTKQIRKHIRGGKVRNVILFVGDGMDETAVTAARNYELGAAGRFTMDRMRIAGSVTTYGLNELMGVGDGKPFYVTDSAASGTAWATGHKTGLLRISTEAFTNKPLTTLAELAQKKGYRTGNVTTDTVTGATPAVLMSHVGVRNCQAPGDVGACGDDLKSEGGLGSISEQAADSRMDLILGGGLSKFEETIPYGPDQDKTVIESAQRQGFGVFSDPSKLRYRGNKRLFGLFAGGTMTPEWSGQPATRDTPVPLQRCETDNRPADQPSLTQMTRHGIGYLNRRSRGKKKGFFLQVEGAGIDKGAHAANPCRQIGETVEFDNAITAAVEFAKKQRRTMVIVTADHAQSGQILPGLGADKNAILITNEGGRMVMGYATARGDSSQEHTGITVPVRALGPQAAHLMGMRNQTGIFHVIANALKLK